MNDNEQSDADKQRGYEVSHYVFTSCGNDSTALLQYCFESGIKSVHACYSDTQWGSSEWPDRVRQVADWVRGNGGEFHTIKSEGFANICKAKRNQAFPRDGMQFCTYELKIEPAMRFLAEHDPSGGGICMVGIRREESARRRLWPEWTEESENHGGRSLWAPLVRHTEVERNELILRSGIPLLGYRSRECFPCVNASKFELANLPERDIKKVAKLENEMGVGKRSGKQKYMFRSSKCQGAEGIEEVVKWAGRTKYIKGMDDMFSSGCDSGFCGD